MHDKTNKTTCVPSDDSDQTGPMPSLFWVFAGCTGHFVGFVMLLPKWYWKENLIRIKTLKATSFKSMVKRKKKQLKEYKHLIHFKLVIYTINTIFFFP